MCLILFPQGCKSDLAVYTTSTVIHVCTAHGSVDKAGVYIVNESILCHSTAFALCCVVL